MPRLPCLFRVTKAVSSTVELVISVTSGSVNLFNIAIWTHASECSSIELVPCSDERPRTWWQPIHMIPRLPVSSIPQWKSNRHQDACLQSFQAIERFECTFIETHQALKMICKVRSLKSWIKKRSILEKIITSRNEVFKDSESDMAVGIKMQCNRSRESIER